MNDARFGEVAHNFFNHSEPPSGWKKSTTSSIASRVFSVDYGFLGDNWSFFPSFAGAIEFYRWRCAYLSPGKNHATGLTAGLKECCYNLVLNLRRELWKLTMYKCCVYFVWEKADISRLHHWFPREMPCILMRRHYQDVDTVLLIRWRKFSTNQEHNLDQGSDACACSVLVS